MATLPHLLTLLGLSAAFDTIYHDILMRCLPKWYGISSTSLSWFSSYLFDRRQAIKIGKCFSDMFFSSQTCCPPYVASPRVLLWGLCFSLYTTPLSSVNQRHNLDHYLYAPIPHRPRFTRIDTN